MNEDLRTVYGWVKGSRERVLDWTESLPHEVYTRERPDFAYGSIRNIHSHVLDCYYFWVGALGLGIDRHPGGERAAPPTDAAATREAFLALDQVMGSAFDHFATPDEPLVVQVPGHGPLTVTGRWLVMHPITHEFHHKGQMLALGRVLGRPYPPGSDTDLPEPFPQTADPRGS